MCHAWPQPARARRRRWARTCTTRRMSVGGGSTRGGSPPAPGSRASTSPRPSASGTATVCPPWSTRSATSSTGCSRRRHRTRSTARRAQRTPGTRCSRVLSFTCSEDVMITRRDFIASSVTAAGAGLIVPPVLAKSVLAANLDGSRNDRVLVVLQLMGGNDGLNTVVPYADPAYRAARPSLGLDASTLLPLGNGSGLHASLVNCKKLYDAGQLAIVQGVGYPQPTYSHFESSYVWQHADPNRRQADGWLGSLLAAQLDENGHPLTACALQETATPAELQASGATVSVIDTFSSYKLRGDAPSVRTAPALYRHTPGPYGVLLDTALQTAQAGMAQVAQT